MVKVEVSIARIRGNTGKPCTGEKHKGLNNQHVFPRIAAGEGLAFVSATRSFQTSVNYERVWSFSCGHLFFSRQERQMGSGAGRLWGWCLLEQVSLSVAKYGNSTTG